jgi:hypothetical protein
MDLEEARKNRSGPSDAHISAVTSLSAPVLLVSAARIAGRGRGTSTRSLRRLGCDVRWKPATKTITIIHQG